MIIDIFRIILPIVFCIGLGMFLKTRNLFDSKGLAGIKSFVLDYLMPINLGFATASIKLSADVAVIPVLGFLMSAMSLVIGIILRRITRQKNRYMEILCTTYENGLLGIALFPLLYPQLSLAYDVALDIGFSFFFFLIWVPFMHGQLTEGGSLLSKLKNVFSSRLLQGVFVGLILNLLGVSGWVFSTEFGSILKDIVAMPLSVITPLILVVVGYEISFSRKYIKEVALTALFRMIATGVSCVVCILLLKLVGVTDRAATYTLILASILPSPFASSVFAGDPDNTDFINMQVSTYLAVTLTGLALMVAFLR